MADSAQQLAPEAAPLADLSAALKAAGDPLRLEVLQVLARGSYSVWELCRIMDLKQSAMSHHLKVLANGGWLATRREGNAIYYRRAQPAVDSHQQGIATALFRTLDETPVRGVTAERLAVVQHERAQASQAFFAANAHKFREQQDLIASHPVYGEHVAELLRSLPLQQWDTALEIGPGEGEFLPVLSRSFKQVYAIDNSLNMLNQAQALGERQNLDNVSYFLGDTQTALAENLSADCVVVNMVLHHVPSPYEIFQDVGQLMNPGGVLLVTELCRHDQEWATDACGDIWLGFEPQDLAEWARDAGLTAGQSSFFALRNGFQIQLRHFWKS